MAIDAKTAVDNAHAFFKSIYQGVTLKNIRVEELELTRDPVHAWAITLGFDLPSDESTNNFMIGVPPRRREYKRFLVDPDDGKVISMLIRTP